eukprot:UN25298
MSSLGCLIGYEIIIADSMTDLIPGSPRWLWVAIGAAVVYPLCFLNQKYLSFISTASVLVNIYLFFWSQRTSLWKECRRGFVYSVCSGVSCRCHLHLCLPYVSNG